MQNLHTISQLSQIVSNIKKTTKKNNNNYYLLRFVRKRSCYDNKCTTHCRTITNFWYKNKLMSHCLFLSGLVFEQKFNSSIYIHVFVLNSWISHNKNNPASKYYPISNSSMCTFGHTNLNVCFMSTVWVAFSEPVSLWPNPGFQFYFFLSYNVW